MTTPLGSSNANPPGLRLDPARLDPAWPAPTAPRAGGSTWVLVVVAILILVVGSIWAGGGFERRQDRVQAYPPGTTIDAGSFTFRLDRAEVRFQQQPSFGNDQPHWELRAYGTATNTAGEPLTLSKIGVIALPDGWIYRNHDFEGLVRTPDGELVRTGSLKLEPGLSDVPVHVSGELPAEWEPTSHVFVGVREQSYAAHRLDEGFADEWWDTDSHGRTVGMWVPVHVLPPNPPEASQDGLSAAAARTELWIRETGLERPGSRIQCSLLAAAAA